MENPLFNPISYPLMHENRKIGDITVNLDNKGRYIFDVKMLPNVDNKVIPWALKDRTGRFVAKDRNESLHRRLTRNWLEERVFPEERHDAEDVLGALNMTEYDIVSVLKRTDARNRYDDYWIKFKPNSRYRLSEIKKLKRSRRHAVLEES